MTVEGIAIGTPGYMSPEQAAGVPSDRRSDIYCTGALLYHLVTGTKAFEGDDVRSVLRRHREETPASPRAIKPGAGISKVLEETLYRAMQRDPSKRFQRAQEMAEALRDTPEAKRRRQDDEAPAASSRSPTPTPTPSGDATRADGPVGRERTRRRAGATARWAFVGLVAGSAATVTVLAYSPLGSYLRPHRDERVGSPEPPARPTPKSSEPASLVAATQTTPAAAGDLAPAAIAPVAVDLALPPAPPAEAVSADAGAPLPPNDDSDDDKVDDGSNENDRAAPPESVELQNHPAPAMRSIGDAKTLIHKGDSDGALAGLYRMRHTKPSPPTLKASEIATLIGDLYFERKWWTDALREYRFAIALDSRAKKNETLIGNSVHALGERVTYARARRLLLDYVGRGAAPTLKHAAKSGATPQLRRRAQKVLATLESKSYRSHH